MLKHKRLYNCPTFPIEVEVNLVNCDCTAKFNLCVVFVCVDAFSCIFGQKIVSEKDTILRAC